MRFSKATLASLALAILLLSGCSFGSSDSSQVNIQEKAKKDFVKAINETQKTDKDFDGLTDSEEAKQGTDPAESDTDKDGLLDGTELKFKTNSLKPDSDGDGVSDGDEVRRGQNPLGSGPLPPPQPKQ